MAKQLMKGCEAVAEAAIMAGCRYFFGYPITPQNDIPEYMARRMPQVGGCFLQSESEVAAINMVYGASAAGARVMTSSSSPGISLKQEGMTYIAGAELPCVVVNMVRGGPGLGSIQPSQGDYFQATRGGGHGDYHPIVLAPSSVQEAVDLMQDAFDLADQYRTPVMILADGIIGQMMEPVEFTERKSTRVLPKKDWAATGWTPASDRPRAIVNSLYIEVDELQELNDRLQARYKIIRENETRAELYHTEGAEIIICAYGTVARICKSAINLLEKQGCKVGLFRPITVWPFPEKELAAVMAQDSVKKAVTVEISAGQMVEDVKLAVNGTKPVEFFGKPGSYTPTAEEIAEYIIKSAREA
ncbi:MAG: 3-methyl-2-oxobutanoate dehydrogenase subunit VorB [Eubacteriales bacterium]|nr:3-methyl-2-oxobutanoate dehydrogenase subunit VorB [Eubacteriales bacterium]MCI7778376.1 3-methyl-2-oxobutanoate dehydrogenase subunit VorB [Clostridiales bacterium]MDD6018551.1 3-methyl-2-oxobutanoate dehydrogenase subunit VorB [Clostridiales bacterium]MDD7488419.1 3-methyl-2-oxobutanoate dehydrogenase subunit VorB [Clostridiales bacterium]MDD7523843.1 3-methyl-2-oxobutanoate dehydrogenase subunit VorB [Clostridiales bacterium]